MSLEVFATLDVHLLPSEPACGSVPDLLCILDVSIHVFTKPDSAQNTICGTAVYSPMSARCRFAVPCRTQVLCANMQALDYY